MISIYSIIFENNIIYIGQTIKSIDVRFKEHKSNARRDKTRKKCPKLYNKIFKYGEDLFYINLIEMTEDPIIADERERFWIKYYKTIETGCNICEGGRVNRGFIKSKKQRLSQSIIAKNNYKKSGLYSWNGSEEQKSTLKKKYKNRNITWGNILSKVKNDGPYKLILDNIDFIYTDIGINKIAKIHNLNAASLKLSLKNNSIVKTKGHIAKVEKYYGNKSII